MYAQTYGTLGGPTGRGKLPYHLPPTKPMWFEGLPVPYYIQTEQPPLMDKGGESPPSSITLMFIHPCMSKVGLRLLSQAGHGWIPLLQNAIQYGVPL